MPTARWNDTLIASDHTEKVEGNHYFPPSAVDFERLRESDTTSVCPWKGTARYYHVVVGDRVNEDAAWYYPDPKPAAVEIADHVAFWRGVEILD